MRSIIPELLFVGNARDARDVRTVLSLGVQVVVDVAANQSPIQYPRDMVYCRFPLTDGPGNSPAILRLAVSATAEFIKAKVPVLVSCSAGMSRSLAVAAAALALVNRQQPDDVLLQIASSGPHDVACGLWADLQRMAPFPSAGLEAGGDAPAFRLIVLKTLEVDRLPAFYSTLGIRFVEERHGKGPLHFSARVGGTVFEIYPVKSSESVQSGVRLDFEVANLAETVEIFRAAGSQIVSEPKAGPWGLRAVVHDPDGRTIEIYQQQRAGQ